jgi:hypothetical protein
MTGWGKREIKKVLDILGFNQTGINHATSFVTISNIFVEAGS